MARSLSKAILIGIVGREPEMRFTPQGKPVATFGLGTCSSGRDAERGSTDADEWFNVVAWGSLAELCAEELSTGRRVYVEGRLRTREWTNAQGHWCARVDVVASEVILLDASHEASSGYADQRLSLNASRGEGGAPIG